MRQKVSLLVLCWLALSAQMKPDETVRVHTIIDGRCFTDLRDRPYCLKGVIAPPLTSPDHEGGPAPHADVSRERLWQLIKGEQVWLAHAGLPDRWGRQPTYLLEAQGFPPFQETLLREGMVRLNPMDLPNEKYTARFRTAERDARDNQNGLWGLKAYQILDTETAEEGLYQIRTIRAQILEVSVRRDRVYLNTGDDYKTDFTITIPTRIARQFEREGMVLETLKGKTVEATGWLEYINGPSMELAKTGQLQLLD